MKTEDLLRKARKRIENKQNWCKGYAAVDKDGLFITPTGSPAAVSWCAMGAIRRESSVHYGRMYLGRYRRYTKENVAALKARKALVDVLPEKFVVLSRYNDHPETTHAEILELFDRAIEAEAANKGE